MPAGSAQAAVSAEVAHAHKAAFTVAGRYPSAHTCGKCHPDHFREWSVSQHAYAQISPVFVAMSATVGKQTQGTLGDFCIRCHTPVGMNLGESPFMSTMDRHPTSQEGVTCVVCHRLKNEYGKVSGRISLVEGGLTDPVFGPTDSKILNEILKDPNVTADPTVKTATQIHSDVENYSLISEPGFCGSCHDVTMPDGFRLEEAFAEYKNTPAAKNGVSCQDCHMGKTHGKAEGYATGPAAVVNGKPTADRKRTNHMFPGPDYSIVHPGIFPHNIKARELTRNAEKASAWMQPWLKFDHEAGWGTRKWEKEVYLKDRANKKKGITTPAVDFPEEWRARDKRLKARKEIDKNLKLLEEVAKARFEILRVGYQLGELKVTQSTSRGLKFKVEVKNGTDGHNVPTGFDAERLVYVRVTVSDTAGKVIYQSGDLDPNGDVRDLHSAYVHNGELPLDRDLFSLQSKFVTRNLRGGEREQVLPVNYSPDPLPFIRPPTRSNILTGRPAGARKHKQGLGPLDHRWADYNVSRKLLAGEGPYQVRVQFVSAMVPVNLIAEIKVAGFDYNMSPREVADRIREGHMVLWDKTVSLKLDGAEPTFDLTGANNDTDSGKEAK
jgi:hypothetical protein